MPIALRRGLAIPLWATAFCAVAISEPHRVMPLVMTLIGIAALGSTMRPIIGWFPLSRRHVEGLPSLDETAPPSVLITTRDGDIRTADGAMCTGFMKPDDAADLMRMDDDGGGLLVRAAVA